MAKMIGGMMLQTLHDAGILPPNCRRVIIDAKADDVVHMYFECFGDERVLRLDLPTNLGACDTVRIWAQDMVSGEPIDVTTVDNASPAEDCGGGAPGVPHYPSVPSTPR